MENSIKSCAVIVAHPDDETLWAGGTILGHPEWRWLVLSLCRKNDKDRSVRFHQVMSQLNAQGVMGDLDDGPDQFPLPDQEVEQAVLDLLPTTSFDLILTHSPRGEYTRHLRHEETSWAVLNLLESGRISTKELWLFAYEDHQRAHFPIAIEKGTFYNILSPEIWEAKYEIVTGTYGFDPGSWEAHTTPKSEAFWRFETLRKAKTWFNNNYEGTRII